MRKSILFMVIVVFTFLVTLGEGSHWTVISSPWEGDIIVDTLGDPTQETLEDWFDYTQSAVKLTGGGFTDLGSGVLRVAAGTGIIKTTASSTGDTKFFDWAQDDNVQTEGSGALTDGSVNYIYVSYNSGSPAVYSTITDADINGFDEVKIGRVYRDGSTLHLLEGGAIGDDIPSRVGRRFRTVEGFIRATGMQTSETGDLNMVITSGTFWNGLNEYIFAAHASATDSFTAWYVDDGATWVSNDTSLIDNFAYNDIEGVDSGLVELTTNQYGVHWVYIHNDGGVHVVYGYDSYTLAEAQSVNSPGDLPGFLVSEFTLLLAKIIIEKNESSSFTDVLTPWEERIPSGTVTSHSSLSGLQGGTTDEYYHITSAQNTGVAAMLADSANWNTAYDSSQVLTSTYETIANVGLIGDDTTNFKATHTKVASDSANWTDGYDSSQVLTSNYATLASPVFTGSVEIPNGTNPTVDADGEIAWESDEECLRVWDGAANRAIPTTRRITFHIPADLADDTIDVFLADSLIYPFGVKILKIVVQPEDSVAYSCCFAEWTDSTLSAWIDTVGNVTASWKTQSVTFTDSDIAVNHSIRVGFDSLDVSGLINIFYYIKTGD